MGSREWTVIAVCTFILCLQAGTVLAAPPAVDLTKAVVVTQLEADPVEAQAATMLRGEVGRRVGVWDWGLSANDEPAYALPADDVPAIVVGSIERMPPMPAKVELPGSPMKDGIKPAAEGYILHMDTKARAAPTLSAGLADGLASPSAVDPRCGSTLVDRLRARATTWPSL